MGLPQFCTLSRLSRANNFAVTLLTTLLSSTDLDVGTVEVDGCVRNQPAPLGSRIEDHRLLAPEFEYLALVRTIRRRIEVVDALTDTQPRANGVHPSGLIQDAIDGGAQPVQLEGGSAVEGRDGVGEVHALLRLVALPQPSA